MNTYKQLLYTNFKHRSIEQSCTRIPFVSREEWLSARRSGLGGSDIAAIMGLSPYGTADSVRESKTTDVQKPQTDAMKTGSMLEGLALHKFAERETSLVISRNRDMFRSREHIFALATPDAFCTAESEEGFGVIEIKTTSNWNEKRAKSALLQNLWYQCVCGAAFGYLAVLELRDYGVQYYKLERDDKVISDMLAVASSFWSKM